MIDPRREIPANAMLSAIVARLSGNVTLLDGSTLVEVFDHVPRAHTDLDFIAIDALLVSPAVGQYRRTWSVTAEISAWSQYAGFREVSHIAEQIVQQLGAPIAPGSGWSDLSAGGTATEVALRKVDDEAGRIARVATIRYGWEIQRTI